tara:strand:- start:4 stop:351 length:348 start_codon:yes stop_codon:yes gene_type:complete
MSLGNANTSAQARGKNKPVKIKFHKEHVLGKAFTSYSSSLATFGNACALKAPSMVTYYHNGSGTVPGVGDSIYAKPHANKRYILSSGNYQVLDGKTRKSITTNRSGAVTAVATCK